MKYFLKGFTKICVEDGVDKRVDNGVDVAQPSGDQKCIHAGLDIRQIPFDGNGVDCVASEKWNPTK